jgi:dienelactone hydrolase
MRKLLLEILYSLLLLWFSITASHAQQVFKTTSPSVIGYLEYVPQDYNTNSNKYPVVIFLHGIGERGINSTDPAAISGTIQNVAKLGPPMYVKNGTQFPFILISPQLKNNYGTWPSSYVKEVINHVKTYLRIDERRIYLTGLSLGGGGVWVAAQDFPELFAAIAPVCGGYNSPSKACGIASENLPVWAFHGDKDTVVPMSKTVNMVNAINACTPAPSPLAKLTIYAGVGHSAWNNAYKTDNSVHDPNVYQWIQSFINTTNKGNKIPLANAGSDKTIFLTGSTTLTGSGTDTDGTIATYAWTQIGGPSTATLVNNLTSTLTVSGLAVGAYQFRLTVTDNTGNTDSDYIQLTVGTDNILPVANAGADKTIVLPANSVTITGSGTDADGTIASYTWTKVSGGVATLSGTSAAILNVTDLIEGGYVFRLTVTDNRGGSKSDDMKVTVAIPNVSPIANAGADKTIMLPVNSVTITGSGTDADGTIISYAWTKVSGGAAVLGGTSTATLTASGLEEGLYTFRLTVKDNRGRARYDDMNVIVVAGGVTAFNEAPIVNAGADTTITLPISAPATITGSASDPDGSISYHRWYKISGPYVYYTGVMTYTLNLSKLYAGTYKFKLVVRDNLGLESVDEVTIIVKDVIASATSFQAQPALLAESVIASEITDAGEQYAGLGNTTPDQLENATVVIFNDSGEKIFTGAWDKESYREVMNRQGLYIYNVIKEGRRTNTGKIYIRN